MSYNGDVLHALAQKLGLSVRRRPPAWRRTLAARGVDRLALSVLGCHDRFDEAWARCPRVDWALEVAVRGRVERALVVAGLHGIAAEAAGWRAVPTTAFVRARRLTQAWMTQARTDDALLSSMRPHLLSVVEAAPELLPIGKELAEAERWRHRVVMQTQADLYDAVHAGIHRRLADRFRRHVDAEAVRFALEGQRSHPYR